MLIRLLDGQQTRDAVRIIMPNEHQLRQLLATPVPRELADLLRELGEERPISFDVGSNSEPAPLPNNEPIRTVAT